MTEVLIFIAGHEGMPGQDTKAMLRKAVESSTATDADVVYGSDVCSREQWPARCLQMVGWHFAIAEFNPMVPIRWAGRAQPRNFWKAVSTKWLELSGPGKALIAFGELRYSDGDTGAIFDFRELHCRTVAELVDAPPELPLGELRWWSGLTQQAH